MGLLMDRYGPKSFSWFVFGTTLGLWALYAAVLWVGREEGRERGVVGEVVGEEEGGVGIEMGGGGGRREGGAKELEVEDGRPVMSA